MNGYIDIHSHILPDVDDGSSNWEMTMDMLHEAYNEDIRIIIATPHYGLYNPTFDIDIARNCVAEVNYRMENMPFKIDVFLGNEIYYIPGIVKDVLDGKAATLGNTSYVLLEFSESVKYETVEAAVQEFTRECYRPIIAHAERYSNLIDIDLVQINKLKKLGAYFQINTNNFTRKRRMFKKDMRSDSAKAMLKAGFVDFIASDAHNNLSRKPVMKNAIEQISTIACEEQLNRLFSINPKALAFNEYIER